MNTSRLITAFFALLLFSKVGFAFNDSIPKHALGFNAGLTTGVGISYRHWPMGSFGFQGTVLPIYTQDGEETFTFISVGTTVFRRIHRSGNIRLLSFASLHSVWMSTDYKDNSFMQDSSDSQILVGIGPAIEYETGALTITMGTGYHYSVPIDEDVNEGTLSYTLELGFHYAFGPKVLK